MKSGGTQLWIDGTVDTMRAYIDEERFDIDSMRKKNRESIYLDGIENVVDGVLYLYR